MKKAVARLIIAAGMLSSLGFGILVKNEFDMIFLACGSILMLVGSILLALSTNTTRL
jgi:hypothetical protein